MSLDQKYKVEYTSLKDGEFWMSFDDFCSQFGEVSMCTLGPDFDKDGIVDQAGDVCILRFISPKLKSYFIWI